MRKVFSVMALAATMMLGTATVATANEEAKVEIISADQVDNMPVVLAQNEPAADADPATATAEEQIHWYIKYIRAKYGDGCQALKHHRKHNWY